MNEWKKFNETLFPEKEEFYSNLNIEDITGADYMHAKRVCKVFDDIMIYISKVIYYFSWVFSKPLEKYVYVKNLSFRSCKISFSCWISIASSLKKVKLELLTDFKYNEVHRYAKANNKYMKDYVNIKESYYLKYWNVIIYMVGQCRKNVL